MIIVLNSSRSEGTAGEEERTILAVSEFNRFLGRMEKNLSQISKKLHNRETNRSAGFVETGIQEARHYLEIVKKVIEKTQQATDKIGPKPTREIRTASTKPLAEEENTRRILIGTWKGVEIWQGACENCHKDARIASDGSRYLCVECLQNPRLRTVKKQVTKIRKYSDKRTTPKKRENLEGDSIFFKTREYLRRALMKIR